MLHRHCAQWGGGGIAHGQLIEHFYTHLHARHIADLLQVTVAERLAHNLGGKLCTMLTKANIAQRADLAYKSFIGYPRQISLSPFSDPMQNANSTRQVLPFPQFQTNKLAQA